METGAPAEAVELAIRCRWSEGDTLEAWRERLGEFSRLSRRAVVLLSAGTVARLASADASYDEVIGALREICPITITGEEGEIFDPALRASHSPSVIAPGEWLAVHAAAHRLGLKTQASMAYGTIDHPAAYAAHLNAIRNLQDETGGFEAFVPMAMHNHGVAEFYLAAPTAAQSLRTAAIARAFLDNVPHIVAVPSLITPEIAVVALGYGADTIDTTISTADVHSAERLAGATASLTVLDETAAQDAGRVPLGKVRSRLEEARWNPIAVDASFAAAVAVAA
jgi:2-iminoacetate synthase ThiH